MTEAHYRKQMDRLASRWSTVYVPDVIKIIWREVNTISEPSFTRIIDELLGTCRQAPLLNEFRELARVERERAWEAQRSQSWKPFVPNPSSCSGCRGTGIVMAWRLDGLSGVYAFRCGCDKGRSDPRTSIPSWSNGYDREFELTAHSDFARPVIAEMPQ